MSPPFPQGLYRSLLEKLDRPYKINVRGLLKGIELSTACFGLDPCNCLSGLSDLAGSFESGGCRLESKAEQMLFLVQKRKGELLIC